jgi:hypothetical protein
MQSYTVNIEFSRPKTLPGPPRRNATVRSKAQKKVNWQTRARESSKSLSKTPGDARDIDGHSRREAGTLTVRRFCKPEALDYFASTGNSIDDGSRQLPLNQL